MSRPPASATAASGRTSSRRITVGCRIAATFPAEARSTSTRAAPTSSSQRGTISSPRTTLSPPRGPPSAPRRSRPGWSPTWSTSVRSSTAKPSPQTSTRRCRATSSPPSTPRESGTAWPHRWKATGTRVRSGSRPPSRCKPRSRCTSFTRRHWSLPQPTMQLDQPGSNGASIARWRR